MLLPSNKDISKAQAQNVFDYTQQIIQDLPPRAIQELTGGYDNDLRSLIGEIHNQVSGTMNFIKTLDTERLQFLEQLEHSIDISLKKLSYNYFKTTVLHNFRQEWRNLEFGNMIQLYPWMGLTAQRGSGKCEKPETEVVMYDGSLKMIKDIKVGDQVMGVDSTPRNVLAIHSGIDDMYKIVPNRGEPYTVNSKHELYYQHKNRKGCFFIKKTEASVFHKKTVTYKSLSFGERVKGWDLPQKDLPIEPYFLGIWLTDGHKRDQAITNPDIEIINYLKYYAKRLNLTLSTYELRHTIVGVNKKRNILLDNLRELNLINNKHIPDIFLLSSRSQRLELLGGLIDGDGTINSSKKSLVFSQNNLDLIKQVQKLCWSLGYKTNILQVVGNNKFSRHEDFTYYQLGVSGDVWEIKSKIPRKKVKYFNRNRNYQLNSLKTEYLGKGKYCGISLDGDHLYLGKDGTVKKNSYEFCYSLPLWRLYSYDKPNYFQGDTIDNHNRKETLLVTNVEKLGIEHTAKIIEEIKFNDVLAEKLNPTGKANLAATKITTETGGILHVRGLYGFSRGLHTGMVIIDDGASESSLYSQEQRASVKERVYGTLQPIVEPGGYFVVVGTPYSELDIYADLKKDPNFKFFEYPAIFPDGKLLSPDRFTYNKLTEIKESVGSIVFTREYLVVPMTSDASIFPREFLERSIVGMENINFVNTINEFPFKLTRVVLSCDFAIAGKAGSDYSCFMVWGKDSNENFYLLHVWRKQTSSYTEQVNQIVSINQRFKPSSIICESNGFQKIMLDLVKNRGVKNVKEFVTTSKVKKNSYDGVPSLSALFERYQIKIPYAEGETRKLTEIIFSEFASIGFIEDKGTLESTGTNDDSVMSSFFAITDLRENQKKFRAFMA